MLTIMNTDLTVTSLRASALQKKFHPNCFACAPDNKHGLGVIFHLDDEGITHASWQPCAWQKDRASTWSSGWQRFLARSPIRDEALGSV